MVNGKGPLSPDAITPPPATAKIWLAVTLAMASAIVSLTAGGGAASIASVSLLQAASKKGERAIRVTAINFFNVLILEQK
jgi:hypothetical protein